MPFGTRWKFDSGAGIANVNSAWNPPARPSGTQVAFIQASNGFEQQFSIATAGKYIISFASASRAWDGGGHDFSIRVDGIEIGKIDRTKQGPYKWTTQSFTIPLNPGVHTLRFQGLNTIGGDHSSFLDDISISNTVLLNPGFEDVIINGFLYHPNQKDTPGLRLTAKVFTTGKSLYCQLARISNGTLVTAASFKGIVKADGIEIPVREKTSYSNHHIGFMVELKTQVKPGQKVTISAPEKSIVSSDDFNEAINNQVIENYSGRSAVRDESKPKKMYVGYNVGHHGTEWSTYQVYKNLTKKVDWLNGVAAFGPNGEPTALKGNSAWGRLIVCPHINNMDDTNFPTPEGGYVVSWSDTINKDPNAVALSVLTDIPNGIINERKDVANTDPTKFARVFEIRHDPKDIRRNIMIALTINGATPNVSDLVIYGPGDFEYKDNTPVVIDRSGDLSNAQKKRMPTDRRFGALRGDTWGGGAVMCEPEHMRKLEDWSWNTGWDAYWFVRFNQARPFTTPGYIYSPNIGESFDATLNNDVTTAPPAGTVETWNLSGVFAGLVIRDKGESIKVLSLDGKVKRGAEHTIPVTHSAGPIKVSSRFLINDLSIFGTDKQICELVSQEPHNLRHGMNPTFSSGFPDFTFSDGSRFRGGSYNNYPLPILVSGPNTILIVTIASKGTAVTLGSPVTLDPNNCFYEVALPQVGTVPTTYWAKVVAQYPETNLRINLPHAATDDYIYELATQVKDILPPGRQIWLEVGNETWNGGFPATWYFSQMDQLIYKSGYVQKYYAHRLGEAKSIFAKVFGNRASEIKAIANVQTVAAWEDPIILDQGLKDGTPIDGIFIAPYWGPDGQGDKGVDPSIIHAFNTWDLEACIDLCIWDIYYSTHYVSVVSKLSMHRKAIDAWNAKNNANVELQIYEMAPDIPWPVIEVNLVGNIDSNVVDIKLSNTNWLDPGMYVKCDSEWLLIKSINGNIISVAPRQNGVAHKDGAIVRNAYHEHSRDLMYHPSAKFFFDDWFALCDSYGVTDCTWSNMCQAWVGGNHWGAFHWMNQAPGDGLDNRLTQASPGPNQKPDNVNQDLNCVSVVGEAIKRWNVRDIKKQHSRFIPHGNYIR